MGGGAAAAGIQGISKGIEVGLSYALNRKMQKYAFAHQKDMRATAYQATIKDMREAGLNPILAAGTGASATPGASNPGFSMPDLSGIAQTALHGKRLSEDIKKMKEERRLLGQKSQTEMVSRDLMRATAYKNMHDANFSAASTFRTNIESKLRGLGITKALGEADIDASTFGEIMRHISRGTSAVPLIGAAKK